ncbi:MAG: prolyl oligopeptidase family serine peptidase [Maricaulis sp.]|nr:prolyl oligopeptidase family serine peptidase [Maricaulis sp.]
MIAWLTLPHGSDRDGDGRPDTPVPMIVMPHGGPWDQSHEAFDPWQRSLADRGYAVLSPNFRGSTGYGKARLNAGDQAWGGVIQNDVIDASG